MYFANPTGIENILSRVTGLTPSQIDGLLGVEGSANLFLLNPHGIIFGPNAQLDVSGSLVASTGDRFRFADGNEFRATDPNAAPLVTVNIPLGLQSSSTALAPLTSEADLAVGGDLTLLAGTVTSTGQLITPAGNVRVEGVNGDVQVRSLTAQSATLAASENLVLTTSRLLTSGDLSLLAGQTVRVRDSSATPFLAAAGGNLLIQGAAGIDILALNHPQTPFQAGGHLTLASNGIISGDAHFRSGGNFSIEDLDGNPGTFVSLYDPIISAEGNVTFGDYQGTALKVEATGSIAITGDIVITGPDQALDIAFATSDPDIAILTSRAALILRAGVDAAEIGNTEFDLFVDSPGTDIDNTLFAPATGVLTDPSTGQPLAAGSILMAGNITTTGTDPNYVQNGYAAGPVILSATGDIVLEGSLNTAAAATTTSSSAGNVSIVAGGNVALRNGALSSSPTTAGAGGDLRISGSAITLQGYDVLLESDASSQSGTVNFNASQSINLINSRLTTSGARDSAGQALGTGGAIALTAGSTVSLDNSAIATTGNRITIQTGVLDLQNESLITGGDITLVTAAIVAETPTGSEGSDIFTTAANVITITTGNLDGIAVRSERTARNDIVGGEVILNGEVVTAEPELETETVDTLTRGLEGNADLVEDLPLPALGDQDAETAAEYTSQCFRGKLVQGGRGGLPTSPTDLLRAIAPTFDWVDLTPAPDSSPSTGPSASPPLPLITRNAAASSACDR